jgi:hypothetical protein
MGQIKSKSCGSSFSDEISLGFYSGQYLEQQNEQPKAEQIKLIGLKYERDPKRGTRGKPGGFLLIWPAMGLDARFSAAWFHPVTSRFVAASLPRKSKHGHTWPPSRARVETVQDRPELKGKDFVSQNMEVGLAATAGIDPTSQAALSFVLDNLP